MAENDIVGGSGTQIQLAPITACADFVNLEKDDALKPSTSWYRLFDKDYFSKRDYRDNKQPVTL